MSLTVDLFYCSFPRYFLSASHAMFVYLFILPFRAASACAHALSRVPEDQKSWQADDVCRQPCMLHKTATKLYFNYQSSHSTFARPQMSAILALKTASCTADRSLRDQTRVFGIFRKKKSLPLRNDEPHHRFLTRTCCS